MEKGKRRKLLARQWWCDETEIGTETETDNCRLQTGKLEIGDCKLETGDCRLGYLYKILADFKGEDIFLW